MQFCSCVKLLGFLALLSTLPETTVLLLAFCAALLFVEHSGEPEVAWHLPGFFNPQVSSHLGVVLYAALGLSSTALH